CDMPHADGRVLLLLLERAIERDLDACLLETEGGVEPLCAVYRRTCLEPIRAALDEGERKVTRFEGHARADGRPPRVGVLAERELPGDLRTARVALNLTTPEDVAAAGGRA